MSTPTFLTTPTLATEPAVRWWRAHPVVAALAVIGAVVVALAAFEAIHWAAEGFPPPREHAVEMLHHLAGVIAKVSPDKYMW